jgi:hypothetical protein
LPAQYSSTTDLSLIKAMSACDPYAQRWIVRLSTYHW